MVKILLNNGAELNTPDFESQVPQHRVANTGSTSGDENGVIEHDSGGEAGDGNDDKIDGIIADMNDASSKSVAHPEPPSSDIEDEQGQTPLHLAAEAGYDLIVDTLLTSGANPCAETKKEETALILAAKRGHIKVVKKLLAFKSGNFQQSELDKALLMAAIENWKAVIIELHKHGARSTRNSVSEEGMTALHWTIQAKSEASAMLLIKESDDDDTPHTNEKQTSLLMASERGMTSLVELLLKRGANIELADAKERTALHLAAAGSYEKTVTVLLLHGEGKRLVNEKDNQGRTALHWAALKKSAVITERMIKNNIESCHYHIADKYGQTALDIASEIGPETVVELLLSAGSDPTKNNDGRTALEKAAFLGRKAIVERLLPKIESPDLKKSALQLAAKAGNLSVAVLLHKSIKDTTLKASTLQTILIAAAANPRDNAINELWSSNKDTNIQNLTDPNIQDERGRSLLMLAIENRHQSLAEYLFLPRQIRLQTEMKDNEGRTALMVAAIENNSDMVRKLYFNGANPDLEDKKGYRALHHAVENGSLDSFMELLEFSNDSLEPNQDCQKRTALHIALEKIRQLSSSIPVDGRKRSTVTNIYMVICVELIRKNIPLGISDENGRNALHLAVTQNLELMVNFLLGPRPSKSSQIMDTKDVEGQTPLLLAAAKGYTSLVDLMLFYSFEPDTKNKNGQTPLLLAAERGDGRSVEKLLTYHANPNIQDKHGRTALSQAAQNGHESVVKTLLLLDNQGNHKTNLNARDNMGRTALILAAENGHARIVETLIGKSANEDVVGYDGKKAWQKAVDKGHTSVVSSLLSKAPIQDRRAMNEALLLASRRGWANLVEVLLVQEVDLTFQSNDDKWTALHMAAMSGHQDVLRKLIGKGVDIVIKDRDGRTALFQATEQGFESIVRLLLERKEIRNDIDAWMGKESLLFAAEKGYDGIAKLLIDNGVDCNATDPSHRTAMALAAANGKERIVELLLKKGASWVVKDKNDRTALHHAAWGGHHNIVEILLDYEPPVNEVPDNHVVGTGLATVDSSVVDNGGQSALHLAAERASLETVEVLLKRRANVNAKCKDGQTVLHRAAWGGSCEVVRKLRKSGADPFNRDNQDKKPWHIAAEKGYETIAVDLLGEEETVSDERIQGERGLIFAAKMGYFSIADCLLKKRAETTVKDKHGRTPLHWAAARGDKELVKLLIGHDDVSINALDHQRRTALCLAVLDDRTAAVEILLQKGLDADMTDTQGQTALHHAAQKGNEEIAQILIDNNADPHIHDNYRRKA